MNKTTLNSQEEKYSMLSLRRATFVGLAAHRLRNISIHALLAESDADNGDAGNGCDAISIHALLAESDLVLLATEIQFENFYPRSPCGERPHGRAAAGCGIHISIHALLAESDRFNPFETFIILPFLSTLSLRRATIHFKPYSVTDIFLSTLSLRRATNYDVSCY